MLEKINSRAQIIMYDLFFALIIFIILFFSLFTLWHNDLTFISKEKISSRMESALFNVSNVLVSSSGIPSNWTKIDVNSIQFIGLVDEKRIIDENKLSAFAGMDYEKSKEKMIISQYDYYIKIEQDFQTVLEKGSKINSEYSVSTQRIVEYKGKPAKLVMQLFFG